MKLLKRSLSIIILCFLLISQAFPKEGISLRNRVNLDGTWSFCTDPERQGEEVQWYKPSVPFPTTLPAGYAPKVAGEIQVPGIWDAQGYGEPTEKVRHNFVGCGWYRRDLHIPSDWVTSNSTYLVLMGISRYAKVWIDGESVGHEAVGCIGSHEWNISPYVEPGKTYTLVVCVDSRQRWDVDPLLGTAQLNDFVEVAWGGLWGHVYVESRPKTCLSDIYLRTSLGYTKEGNVAEVTCGVRATISDEDGRTRVCGTLSLELFSEDGELSGRSSRRVQLNLSKGSAEVDLWCEVPDARLWTPDTPYLYKARVTFTTSEGTVDVLENRYGMREILFAGSTVLLNGKPLYLRGYGDDHIYPEQFSMSTDTNLYRQRLKAIKAFGFNHCRHHSIVMPHEYYDACDELGMLPSPEMLIAYSPQLPGVGDLWKKGVEPGTSPEPADSTIVERFRTVVREYRNHPSILAWVGGNEMGLDRPLWDRMNLRHRCREAVRKEDPDRPFMDCDGDWLKDYVSQGGRDTEDCYSILFDEWCNPIMCPDKYQTPRAFDKPTVAHEMGNYLTFSRTSEVPLFQNTNFFPFWMKEGSDRLRQLGLEQEVEDWALASEQLYLTSHKYSIESARRNETLSGYHLWQINDYWTSSNGLFDHFFRPKSIRPEDFLPFNSPVVLLQKGLQFSYVEKEPISCSVQVSNYGPSSLHGTLSCTLSIEGKEVYSQTKECSPVLCGKLSDSVGMQLVCPEVERPTLAVVRVDLQANDSTYSNSWNTYLFPSRIAPSTRWPIYADEMTRKYFPIEWNVHSLSELSDDFPTEAVYAVAWSSAQVSDAVRRGAGLIHFDAAQFLPSLPLAYKQSWWKAGDSETENNTGTFVYKDDLVDEVVDHHYCGPMWAPLVDGGKKFSLESQTKRPEVIVRALSSIVRVRDAAVLFHFGYGKGMVMVDGLNHKGHSQYPLSQWLLARMVDRVSSSEKSKIQWNDLPLEPSVSLPEGTTLGLQHILKFNEAMQWNAFYDMSGGALQWICRQNNVGNEISWQTAVPKKNVDGNVTFVFAGSMGYATQPATEGFVLQLNGRDLVPFDVVNNFDGQADYFSWKNGDGKCCLEFKVLSEQVPNDKYGIFKLTVPLRMLKVGQSQILSVRSLGKGSLRWFGLQSYYNLDIQ